MTKSPNRDHLETEIETALEAFVGPDGETLWRRVVVRSASSSNHQVLHASYMLPTNCPAVEDTENSICWASFPKRPKHQFLCVLASSTLLCIWDVYPDSAETELGGDGHSIPLPFEASAIYPIGEQKFGLFIQRKESVEDRLAFDLQNKTWTMSGLQGADEDDDGFVLKAPPRPLRLSGDFSSNSFGGSPIPSSSNPVPSLFSLSHPLDDVLPVSLMMSGETQAGIVTDVFEKIIFVGILRWTDPTEPIVDRKLYTQPICVTYHMQRKRYVLAYSIAMPFASDS